MTHAFKTGDHVEILMNGEWDGPHIVTDKVDPYRPDHIVLLNRKNGVYFVHYNDAPYNTRAFLPNFPATCNVYLMPGMRCDSPAGHNGAHTNSED